MIKPANSAFQCVICPENHYCTNGEKYECPANRPVTDGGQKASDSDCITCFAKTGNSATAGFKDGICTDCFSANSSTPVWGGEELGCTTCFAARGESTPVYSDQEGDCVSCAQATANAQPIWDSSSKSCVSCGDENPFWNGRQCAPCQDGYYQEEIVCPEGTEWNGIECIASVTALAIIPIPDGGSFKIMEVFNPYALGLNITQSACQALIGKEGYSDITVCDTDGDYWAGSYKYCKDKGMRLPTMQELAYIARVVYGNTSIESLTDHKGLTIANQELFNSLMAGTYYESDEKVRFWSSELSTSAAAYDRSFRQSNSLYSASNRSYDNVSGLCVAD